MEYLEKKTELNPESVVRYGKYIFFYIFCLENMEEAQLAGIYGRNTSVADFCLPFKTLLLKLTAKIDTAMRWHPIIYNPSFYTLITGGL